MVKTLLLPLVIGMVLYFYRDKLAVEWRSFRLDGKSWLRLKWKNWGEPFLIAALLAVFIRAFIFGPYKIPTGSMRPTLIEGDRIFVDKLSYRFHEPVRGDVIVFKYPLDPKKDFVKRLVGLPGETLEIKDGKIYIEGKPLEDKPFSNFYYENRNDWSYGKVGVAFTIPQNHYFAMGDNSGHSSDSRYWGFVPKSNMVGKAFLIWWPPKRIRLVR